MKAPLNVAIVGAGGIAQVHFEGYRQAGANVVAFADSSEVTRQLRGEQWNARGYPTFEELLGHERVQAISICTPNAFHAPVALMALERGIHVLCEKPLSLNLDDCDRMIDAARAGGLVLQTGHHLRSNPFVETARRLIDEGRLGRITFLRLRQAHDWGGAEEVRASFGSLAASGGGTLLDNGCHLMDLARHFAGNVVSVAARMNTLKFEMEVEDTSVVTLEFESGALASIENAWTATGWEESFVVYGTKGALECSNRLGEPKLRFLHRESGPGHQDVTWYEFEQPSAHQRGVGRFVRSVTEGAPVVCTGEDGRESVRLVLEAYRSARSGQFVELNPSEPHVRLAIPEIRPR